MATIHAQGGNSVHTTPPGRQRGVLRLWMLALLVLVGAGIGVVLAGVYVYHNVKAKLLITDTPTAVTVVEPFKVGATILNQLEIVLDDTVHTRVPVDTTLSVPVTEPLNLLVTFDAMVPIKTTVTLNETITIDQKVAIDTILQASLVGDTFDLALSGKFPVKAEVPVKLLIPINQIVRLQFTAPIKATLKQNLKVPLDAVIEADVPLRTRMSVPINNTVQAIAHLPPTPLPVEILYADLAIQLNNVTFGLADESNEGEKDGAQPPADGFFSDAEQGQ